MARQSRSSTSGPIRAMNARSLFAALAVLTLAACQPAEGAAAAAGTSEASVPFEPRRVVHEGEGRFGGEAVRYRLIAEDTVLEGADGLPGAAVFAFTYLRPDVEGEERPVVFVFNGGPGSSSVWMHMGLFGPRRVSLPDPLNPPATPPFALEDNPHSLLDIADLVMIDPPGTGFSRVLAGGREEEFLGTAADAVATAAFIERWLDAHGRWNSPRYLVGASYGTVRAALTARSLMGGPMDPAGRLGGIGVDGAVLIGQAILSPDGDHESQAARLSAFAATAHHHGRAGQGRSLDAFAAEADAFARTRWLPALFAGGALAKEERREIAEALAGFIGLDADTIEADGLRVTTADFRNQLLADEGLEIGAYDGRYVLPAQGRPATPDPVGDDPAMARYSPAFAAGLRLLFDEAGIAVDARYEAIAFRAVNAAWNRDMPPGAAEPAEALAGVMRTNPDFHLLIATGHHDLVTTPGAADYFAAHAGLPAERVRTARYPSGHMPYLGDDSAGALTADIRALISGTQP
jgi:carboxypeptidase C (cathepsin A)